MFYLLSVERQFVVHRLAPHHPLLNQMVNLGVHSFNLGINTAELNRLQRRRTVSAPSPGPHLLFQLLQVSLAHGGLCCHLLEELRRAPHGLQLSGQLLRHHVGVDLHLLLQPPHQA